MAFSLTMPNHRTLIQAQLLELPRTHRAIVSAVRAKRLRLALDHVNRAISAAPFLSKPLKRAIQECEQVALRTQARDEAEIVDALKEGWETVAEIALHTPSHVSKEQTYKILRELELLKVVYKGRLRDERHQGRGGNRYKAIWTLLVDESEKP